jgi:hypothetical protein
VNLARLKRVYTHGAIIVVNTVALVLILDGAAWVAIQTRHRSDVSVNPVRRYGAERLLRGYPGRRQEDVLALLHETWDEVDRRTRYEALTEFSEAPFRGAYVNVEPGGFRAGKVQSAWPPDPAGFNIFVFGGSTTFGYGVSDDETLPSAIQDCAPSARGRAVHVYNFGRGSYFSTQELMLYYRLLASGHTPSVAIFVDGLNDFADLPAHLAGELDATATLRSLVDESEWGNDVGSLRTFLNRTSLGRFAGWMRRRKDRPDSSFQRAERPDEATLVRVRDRWLLNRKLIGALSVMFHVRPVFVWQPVPNYRYDYRRFHLLREFGETALSWGEATASGYAVMARSRTELEAQNDFLWLADIQENVRENLYVDEFHYTPPFMKEIAVHICGFLQQHKDDFVSR